MTLDDYIKNLLRGNYFLDEAVIVGPYITGGFFENLIKSGNSKKMKHPRSRLTILADDGWDQKQLDTIKSFYNEDKKNKCKISIYRTSSSEKSGLVHIKLYLFIIKNYAETYTKKILLLGSANASNYGFGIHAESFINIDLSDVEAEDRKKLNKYIEALQSGENTNKIKFQICRGSWVSLPDINIANNELYTGFDAWLRRGRLCHKYQPDASFGRIAIRLTNPLPPRDFERPFNENGFGVEADIQSFSRRYVESLQAPPNDDNPRWRSQYFVETFFGHWTSAECFSELRQQFTDPNARERENLIKAIRDASEGEIGNWLDDFKNAINSTGVEIINNYKAELNNFFKIKNKNIDIKYYIELARKKIRRDRIISGDASFEGRYVSGYDFLRLPQLGDDHEVFAINWCAGVLYKISNRRVENKYIGAIRDLLESQNRYIDSAENLLKWMRDNWSTPHISQIIINAHRA